MKGLPVPGLRLFGILCLMLMLVACNEATPDVTNTPAPTAETTDNQAAPEATIEYREAITAITLDNATQMQAIGKLTAPAGSTSTLFAHSFSLDGTRLVAINQDFLVSWNLVTGQMIFTTSRLNASHVFYSSDKTEIYLLLPDSGEVAIFSETGERQTTLRVHENYNRALAFDPENDWLAVGGSDGTVKVWSLTDRTSQVTIDAHENPVEMAAFSLDGETLATADDSGNIALWDWSERQQLTQFTVRDDVNVMQLVFSPDNAQLAVATELDISLWDTDTNEIASMLEIEPGGANDILAYAPDGDFLFSGGSNADLIAWNPGDGAQIAQMPDVSDNRMSLVFSPEGDLMVTTVLDRNSNLWNLTQIDDSGIARATLNIQTRRIVRVGWSPDGYVLAFFDADGAVYLWGIADISTED